MEGFFLYEMMILYVYVVLFCFVFMCLVGEGSFCGPWCLHEILEKAHAKVPHILLWIFFNQLLLVNHHSLTP